MTSYSRLGIDIETYSSVDLTKTGVYKYAESEDFEILLISYKFDDEETKLIDLTRMIDPLVEIEEEHPEFMSALKDPAVIKTAWNASFERTCLGRYFGYMPPEQWHCTMVRAAELGLPMTLAGCGEAIGLPEEKQKLKTGKALIQYFSKPCKPTKVNGGRTRNMPWHDEARWRLYCDYNVQDVETERAILDILESFGELRDSEQKLWCLDQKMNDRGIRVDLPYVTGILEYDETATARLKAEAIALTGLSNPNSVTQLLGWIQSRGVDMPGLTKLVVAEYLEKDIPDDVRRVLEIRQALGKTSTKKFAAMVNATCSDNRLRGILQFYGATRTGRWAGRIVQVHNLPQNKIEDLDDCRRVVSDKDFEMLELVWGEPAFVFSQLVRTAFIASEDRHFIVSDFSAIEARVLAWLADEKWRMETFAKGGDIYCSSASSMFGVPVVKHGINGHLRQKGKVAELACIAEGQLVLTDVGEVPIEDVTTDMKVWNGEEWVSHDGVIYKGEREVIEYEGLIATPDHLVWVEGKQEPIYFGLASTSGAHLVQTGNCCCREAKELENHKGKVRVYDIRNARGHHRFTVSGKLVHNCGYGGGVGAMLRMDTSHSIPEEDLPDIVAAWRAASPNIVSLWKQMESAMRVAIREGRPYKRATTAGRDRCIKFYTDRDACFMELPSGRRLAYWDARLEMWDDGYEHIVYAGTEQTTKKWGKLETYGGKLVENAVQGIARDCLAEALTRVSDMGYDIVMHVHDEMIVDVPKSDTEAQKRIDEAMGVSPEWAKELILKGDGYITEYYKKD